MRHSTDADGNHNRASGNVYPLPTTNFSTPYTNRGGSMTLGGTSQVLMAANPDRRGLLFQNISDENMYIGVGVAATQDTPSIIVGPGQNWEPMIPPNQALNVVSATTGKKFTCFEF